MKYFHNQLNFTFILLIFLISIFNSNARDFYNHIGKCGTPIVNLPNANPTKIKFMRSMGMPMASLARPAKHKSSPSSQGRFLIHYDTTGIDAPDLTDNNNNDVPDYIDSVAFYFEFAHTVFIDSLGYRIPNSDDELGGSNAYDVYISQLGNNGIYGFAAAESFQDINDGKRKFRSYIEIDNDFSFRDSTTSDIDGSKFRTYTTLGIDAVKITAIHEFHHAIQFSYISPNLPSNSLFAEFTSTAFENRFYTDSKDFFQYMGLLTKDPSRFSLASKDATSGYMLSVFGQYLNLEFGDDLMLDTWESIGNRINEFASLDLALQDKGTNLEKAWCQFLPWAYHIGDKAINGEYLPLAKGIPNMALKVNTFDRNQLIVSGFVRPFSLEPIRVIFPGNGFITPDNLDIPDTLDIMVTELNLAKLIASNEDVINYTLILSDNNNNGEYNRIEGTNFYIKLSLASDKKCDGDGIVFIGAGGNTQSIGGAFPNPVLLNQDQYINIPTPKSIEVSETVNLKVYNSGMEEIFFSSMEVVVANDFRVVRIEEVEGLFESGVYIYSIEKNGIATLGKFTVIQK